MKKLLIVTLLAAFITSTSQAENLSEVEASLLSGLVTISIVAQSGNVLTGLLNDIVDNSSTNKNDPVKAVFVKEVFKGANNKTIARSIVQVEDTQEIIEFELAPNLDVKLNPGDMLDVQKINSDYILSKDGKSLVLIQGIKRRGNFRQKKLN